MSDFRLAEPGWIHALWGVAALALALIFLERRAGSQFKALISDLLQTRLVVGPTVGQRYARHTFVILACTFAVFALMRPQWGFEYVNSPRASAELMIALDVSRSMLAEDVAPNRLERSIAEIRDLLEFLVGDQVGLIAFAGRASVLAPMTPDFGYFRLVLDSVGPNSVGRGGTRLEEPIRKAIQGFKATGDVARVLLLITDGEDHDSFPLEAARAAAERGIRIIAIGFGSESGSEIPITDPETGARSLLRDSSGEIVRTRLDGDTLREIALITDGVYVPAGLGALDLESIYDRHIAGLMRAEIDNEGRLIRSEGFQWFVLAAMICLLISVLIGQVRRVSARPVLEAGLLVTILLFATPIARAQPDPLDTPAQSSEAGLEVEAEGGDPVIAPSEGTGEEEAPGDPRENYNLALDALASGRLDAARQHFEDVRSAAGTDGEARYRATYGLAWAAVVEADARLESEPDAALDDLYRAGDFFREAVRLQPANDDPRHNLEIVLRRARVLADSLAQRDEPDLAARLDELIKRQRSAAGNTRELLERIALADQGAQLADSFRREFRTLSTAQRQLLSESDRFAERVDLERENLEATPETERAAEDSVRIVQLQQLEIYLQRARERMGHSRRELRGRRGERAYRRANAALSELKRARDQLRDPVQLLDELLRDGSELARYTQTMAFVGSVGSEIAGVTNAPKAPPWLTPEVLRESQQSMGERTRELDERLTAGVAHAQQAPLPEPTSPEEAAQLEQRRRSLKQVADASPLVTEAASAFDEALLSLEIDDARAAVPAQIKGLRALSDARERFLDLRRMIELAYTDQQRLQGVLEPEQASASSAATAADEQQEHVLELLPALRDAQHRNLSRAARLQELIEDEKASLPEPGGLAGGP
ncbi:MAG: VWA domain-containing protein, partial [Deltaproteobacteria bacterium]|nr:VWA domain-containing protein [Deltaproteobacteria bacterium]